MPMFLCRDSPEAPQQLILRDIKVTEEKAFPPQKPPAIVSSSNTSECTTQEIRKAKLILIYKSTNIAQSHVCPYLKQYNSPIKHREDIQGDIALKYVLKLSVNILKCIPKYTGDYGIIWSVSEMHGTGLDPNRFFLQGGQQQLTQVFGFFFEHQFTFPELDW